MSSPNPNPVNYTVLFERIGKDVKYFNLYYAQQNGNIGLSAVTDILGQYSARPDLIPNIVPNFAGFVSNAQSWCQTVKGFVDATLIDLQQDLSSPSATTAAILPLMVEDMTLNSQTVQKNTIAALNISSAVLATNIGNGFLEGYTNTSTGIPNEQIISEYVVFTCTLDRFGGANAGGEQFSIQGYPSQQYYVGNFNRGNGSGTPISVSNEGGSNFLSNGDFEDVSGTFPNNWNISAGAPLISSNSSSGHSNTSTSCLQLSGNGSAGAISLYQNIAGDVSQFSTYAAGAFIRKAGTVTSGSNLAISITGTGYSTVNLYSGDPSGLATSYALEQTFFNVGAVIPADLAMTISWTVANNAGSGAIVLIDDCAVVQPTLFGGVQYVLYRGTIDFSVGDSFGVLTSDNFAGIFQSFFGLVYSIQLPSSASPSIPDSYAT